MIVSVDQTNIMQAAAVHAASWRESHRSFCSPDFVALHTAERQRRYIEEKIKNGSRFFLLLTNEPVGVVSVIGNLIEDLYVLPNKQNKGYGTELLRYAVGESEGVPSLWILENNKGAERLYRRMGFRETGRRHTVAKGFDEIEFSLNE